MPAQMNFIIGDSIPRGCGSNGLPGGGFADLVAGDRWFWPDASPERTLNDLMVVNGLHDRFVYLGFPINDRDAVSIVGSLISDGTIRNGNRLILTDDGAIPDNSDTYYALYANLIAPCHASGVAVKAMTTKDVSTAEWQARGYGLPPLDSRFDRVLSAGSVSRSGNQCIRDAMAASGLVAHECGADLALAAAVMHGQTLIHIIQSDWIHQNMWGQWRWCRNLLQTCGLTITNIDPVKARVAANWQALQYNAPPNAQNPSVYWTQANALKAIDFCLLNIPFP